MFGKIFRQMYRGSLGTVGPWQALVTFQQMIILADASGIVDMTAEAIARESTVPLEHIHVGLTALEQPDPESRSPDEGGRRIVRLSETRAWGWKIVNYAHYRNLRSEEQRREYHRQYWHKRQLKRRANAPQQNSTGSTHAEADAKAEKTPTAAARPVEPPEFVEIKSRYPKRRGSQPWSRALKAAQARITEGCTWRQLVDGTERYRAFIESTGKASTEYVLQCATFFGPDRLFLQDWTAASGSHVDLAVSIWAELIASEGARPKRDDRIQAAIAAVGGWSAIQGRTRFDEARLRQEFVAAYKGDYLRRSEAR